MADKDLVIKITAETDRAVKEIKKLTKEVKKFSKVDDNLKNTSKSSDKLGTSFGKLNVSLGAIITSAAALGIAMKAVEFSELAASAEQSADAFNRVFEDMGYNVEQEFEKIKRASQGLIPDSAIKQSAVTAASLGVPIEKLAELMEVARVKAREMGTDAQSAFNDLATGIGRGSPMILDNLGLTIKLDEANRKLATELGKTVEQLTKEEKALALTNEVLKSGAESVERYSDAQLTAKERSQQFDAAVQGLKEKIGGAVLPAMNALTIATTDFINSFLLDDANQGLKDLKSNLDAVKSTMNDTGEETKQTKEELKESIDFEIGAIFDGSNVVTEVDAITGEEREITFRPKVEFNADLALDVRDEFGKLSSQVTLKPRAELDTKSIITVKKSITDIGEKTEIKPRIKIDEIVVSKEIQNVIENIEDAAELTVRINPDAKLTEDALKKLADKTTETKVEFKPLEDEVRRSEDYWENRTITVPVVFKPINPPSGSGFSAGGYTGSGSDSEVAGVVHKNEFVIPANAVRAIGVGNLMNLVSGPRGYQNGGLVGADTTPINLNLGSSSFGVMADNDVAEALTRYINNEGGL